MMRGKPASSMQKTYDECYLICSTAVFFETQNNEAEALRSWKNALDQINYHNAYRVSSSYVPRTETERALFESLRQMEMQCKERVDLLEALKQSRKEAGKHEADPGSRMRKEKSRTNSSKVASWLGEQTVPPVQYSDIPVAAPLVPPRPVMESRVSSSSINNNPFADPKPSPRLSAPPQLPVPAQHKSRSPSPDYSKKTMRKTLRPEGRTPKARNAQNRVSRPAPMKAAGLAWDTHPRANSTQLPRLESDPTIEARLSATAARRSLDQPRAEESNAASYVRMPDPADYIHHAQWIDASPAMHKPKLDEQMQRMQLNTLNSPTTDNRNRSSEPSGPPPPPPPHVAPINPVTPNTGDPPRLNKPPELTYRKEYLPAVSKVAPSVASSILERAYNQKSTEESIKSQVSRKPVAAQSVARPVRSRQDTTSDSDERLKSATKLRIYRGSSAGNVTPPSEDADSTGDIDSEEAEWEKKVKRVMNNLPKGLDELAAKNILNEIVVKGDEVHWSDVAGLGAAKKALKEAVVYPFLRPDLFMGLREPARGMLLFGPPGTGKTMLARAVATESKSTFFAISASSLTSKWHGESEKLVRALFGLAKALAPSIIFVDEIDSLLNSRGGNEHEASRRSKTEFLIQWSDLQRAAAGKDTGMGDASRVLVLAATNCPWDIDEAARRRFVRRQYIPLPEAETRETQLRTLLAAQKHDLNDRDIQRLVKLTDGYSGSDITALAKDAAMGPLRNLGEALLFTPMEKIRPICMNDFQASLDSIRPSVSKKGLEEFEIWARDYGERGG